jgi:ABC-type antimicrobial peptide transport system permease subunit
MKAHFFFLLIGAVFGIVAGLMIYLISYNELIKHFTDKRIPIKVSLKSSLITLVFFVVLGFIIGFFIKI